jgi:uncharacterized membrane protein YoaK (UPF0700 family)
MSRERRRHEEEKKWVWTLFLVPIPSMAVFLFVGVFAPKSVPLLSLGVALFPVSLFMVAFWTIRKVSKAR